MQVFCSLPVDGKNQGSLLNDLARNDISVTYKITSIADVIRVDKLATLSQICKSTITLYIDCSLISSQIFEYCVVRGFCSFVITSWRGFDIEGVIKGMRFNGVSIGLEILDSDDLAGIDLSHLGVNRLFLKGHEAGGIVGSEHIHMLFHKINQSLKGVDVELFVVGGVGPISAGALGMMGANGVVVRDQLRSASDYPRRHKDNIRMLGSHETVAIQICEDYFLRVPRTYGDGLQQSIEKKISSCYPLRSAREEQGLLVDLLDKLGVDNDCLENACIGQDYSFAKSYSDKDIRVCDIALEFKGAKAKLGEQLVVSVRTSRLKEDDFAKSLGIRYDLLQGPMTRVSDTPEFIDAVSANGALPFFAAAMLRPDELRKKLESTKLLLGNRTWGVGLLGFLPKEIREPQFQVVKDISPTWVLIAGGRPDQAEDFEKSGIKAFIHAPTLELFKQYIQDGATNLILEGRECGGHVGPVGSLVLWEECTNWLKSCSLPKKKDNYHLVLAGGIADVDTCATARLISLELRNIGFHVGYLSGTPYLYTDEAVESGAIIESYRTTVIEANATVNLETGAGHASRCAVTPFANEFQELKNKLIGEGLTGYQLREKLEKVTLGRLRVATKGLKRDGRGIVEVSKQESYESGMYMLGQSAGLLGKKTNMSELHERLTVQTNARLEAIVSEERMLVRESDSNGRVAIVAMDCMMPDSPDLDRFWEIFMSGEEVVKVTPTARWDPELYYSVDKHEKDRVYSKWGGFIPAIDIDPAKLGIPPVSLKKIEPLQILTLEMITRIFENTDLDFSQHVRDRTAVFLGAGGGIGDMGGKYAARSEVERISVSEKNELYSRLPEWGDETFPGILFNVVAGRVANRLNLKGASYTVDAACASSLAAVYSAYRELTTNSCDLAIAGGVDTGQSPFAFLCFSRSQALSPSGKSKSFDQDADGIAISEGLGVIVMKRLNDAIKANDDIIAVIDGVGAASDGKGSSLTSPQTSGQQLAVQRAWETAGIPASYMSLYEAHGTGTAAGDKTELETVMDITKRSGAKPRSCAVSSTKPNIGHTKSSAGIAGLLHAALCLHHRVLTSQVGAKTPMKDLVDPSSPIFLNNKTSFWPTTSHGRKAGVSAFGFGGTNYHIVLSEAPERKSRIPSAPISSSYLFQWESTDKSGLDKELQEFIKYIGMSKETSLHNLAKKNRQAISGNRARIDPTVRTALIAKSKSELITRIENIIKQPTIGEDSVIKPDRLSWLARCSNKMVSNPIVLLFPGQGALSEGYLDELATTVEQLKDSLDEAISNGSISQEVVSNLLLSRSSDSQTITGIGDIDMADLQPLICSIQLGIADSLVMSGLEPDLLIGHSLGEFSAVAFAGMIDRKSEFLKLVRKRGLEMDVACRETESGMIATTLTDEMKLEQLLSRYDNSWMSNRNSNSQTTISGVVDELKSLVGEIKKEGFKATVLRVSGGFHSPLMSSASNRFKALLEGIHLSNPAISVLSLGDAQYYSDSDQDNKKRLAEHMTGSVDLVKGIEVLADSAYTFINIGPSLTMEKLVKQNRSNTDDVYISLDGGMGGIEGYYSAIAELYCRLPHFQPNIWPRFSCDNYLRDEEKAKRLARVENGMAFMKSEVPYPSKKPQLTAESATNHTLTPRSEYEMLSRTEPVFKASSLTNGTGGNIGKMVDKEIDSASSMDAPTSKGSLQVYSIFSNNLRAFLESQEKVTMALLGGSHQEYSDSLSNTPALASFSFDEGIQEGHLSGELDFSFAELEFSEKVNEALQDSLPVAEVQSESKLFRHEELHPKPEQENSTGESNIESISIESLLTEITADLTGYPVDMLKPSMALEADLGIDSIKRVEILGRLQKAVSGSTRDMIAEKKDDLADAKSIGDIISVLSESGK